MKAPAGFRYINFFAHGLEDPVAPKEILGGKGFSLAEMTRAGLPVPPGFTIGAECCREYHAHEKKWPEGLADEIRRALSWLEEKTGRTLGRAPKPLLVAVRSGAAVSMPGMMDTVLNVGLGADLAESFPQASGFWSDLADFVRSFASTVRGIPESQFADPSSDARERVTRCFEVYAKAVGEPFPREPWDMLVASVSAVFESWNSDRAVQYRSRNDIRNLAGTAVTVQSMFPSQRSGIMFTDDPNRPDGRRIVIEASVGLGENIVQGRVEPDRYTVDRGSLAVLERRGGCLSDAEAADIARMGLKVEEHFGQPMDIEWGLADGALALLQSRPIRGLEVVRALGRLRDEEIARLKALAAEKKTTWAVHNLSETLPAPTPLTWDILGGRFMRDGFVRLYRDLGYSPTGRVAREGFLELVAGRVYMNLDRGAELFFSDFPLEYDPASGQLDRPTRFNVKRAGPAFLLRLPWYLFLMLRAGRAMKRTARTCLEELERRIVPTFQRIARQAAQVNISALPDSAVLEELKERERWVLVEYGPELLKPGFLAAHYHGRLGGTLETVFGPARGRELTARLLAGLDGDKTVEINIALHRVARGEMPMEGFLAENGHRAVNEFELSAPRWREDPSYVLARVRQNERVGGTSPRELHERRKEERRAAEESLERLLREAGAVSLLGEISADLAGAQKHVPYRESAKHVFLLGIELVRQAIEALARRYDLGRDIYFLRRNELGRLKTERQALVQSIQERKLRWQGLQKLWVPEVLSSDDLESLGRPTEPSGSSGSVWTGTGVAVGVGRGPARVLASPSEGSDLGSGYILVCSSTDPAWTPLFVHAAGLVVERGGMLSHGAIVARDFGIPAVVLPDATRLIPTGAQITVDGGRGTVARE